MAVCIPLRTSTVTRSICRIWIRMPTARIRAAIHTTKASNLKEMAARIQTKFHSQWIKRILGRKTTYSKRWLLRMKMKTLGEASWEVDKTLATSKEICLLQGTRKVIQLSRRKRLQTLPVPIICKAWIGIQILRHLKETAKIWFWVAESNFRTRWRVSLEESTRGKPRTLKTIRMIWSWSAGCTKCPTFTKIRAVLKREPEFIKIGVLTAIQTP